MTTQPQYRIHITRSYAFRYVGELSLWTRVVIRLAGWKATRVSN